jgi:hypothetical protein
MWMSTKNRRHFDGRQFGCWEKIAYILTVGNLGVDKKIADILTVGNLGVSKRTTTANAHQVALSKMVSMTGGFENFFFLRSFLSNGC